MKKSIGFLILIMIFFCSTKVYASTTKVEVNVEGSIKNGEEVTILLNMKGLEDLYAASVDYSYDKSVLNILNITAGDFIKKYEGEIMEIGGEVDFDNNKTSYSFTFLGDKKGIDGNGTLAIIKAKILNNDNFQIGQDSLKVKLVKRVGDSVDNYDYNFIGYNKEVSMENSQNKPNSEAPKDNNSSDSSSTESSNTANNNKESSNSNNKSDDTIDSNTSTDNNDEKDLENNKDKKQYNDESKSSSENTTKNENKISKHDKNNSEVSKHNLSILLYILIPVGTIMGGSYYYYNFRKPKAMDNSK